MNIRNVIPMLAVLYGSAFVASFNENTVNVALISIMGEFSIDANMAQWLVTGYMIVTAIVVTITAFLNRRLRLRTLFLMAVGFLAFGLAAALLAPTWPLFLAARLVQAIGTGIFIPTMMSTVLAVAPKTKMGTYLAIGSCMITFGPAFAPVVSGIMVTSLGWRAIFLPPVVIIFILGIAGAFCIRNIAEPRPIKLDVLSVVLSALGLFSLVQGLSSIMASPASAVCFLVAGIAILAGFVVRQFRIDNPLLNLRPLKNPLFAPICVLMIVAMLTSFSMSVLLPLYFEGALGTTAFLAGALLLAPILVNAGTSLVSGRIYDKHGCWPLLPAGFCLIAVGQITVCLVSPAFSLLGVLGASIVVYGGLGFIFSPAQTAGLQTLPPDEYPHGVAILNTFIQIAASIGPSLLIGILSGIAGSAQAGGAAANAAQAKGFSGAVAVASAIALIGLIVAFVYARKRHAMRAEEGAAPLPTQVEEVAIAPAEPITVASVMKAPYVVLATATVREVMERLIERKTSGLPVVDANDAVVGFVSDGDVLAAIGKQDEPALNLASSLAMLRDLRNFDERFADALSANVMDIATRQIVSVSKTTSIDDVCALLASKRIKKVPVVEAGKLQGTISRSDVVRALMATVVEYTPALEPSEAAAR